MSYKKNVLRNSSYLLLSALVFASGKAVAGAAPETGATQVQEIVVTARYRKEDLQNVPVGVTALNASQLQALGGTFNLKQLFEQLPSLNIQGYSGRNQTFTVRGIGTDAGLTNDGVEPGVGLYIDGVYRPRPGAAITDLLDVDSIQLLRGPQGTLFGKNTVAGAIDIQTVEPSLTPEVKVETSIGSYNYFRGYLSVSGPLTDDISARLSYLRTSRDGDVKNVVYNQNWDNIDNQSARADILYHPNDNFKLRVVADYSQQQGNDGFSLIDGLLPTTLANGTQVRGFLQRAADVGYVPLAINPQARQVDLNSNQFARMPSYGVEVRADWQTDGLNFTSISAYRDWKWLPHFDADGNGADIISGGTITRQEQYSQEFRLASQGHHLIDFSSGLFFFGQTIDGSQSVLYGTDAVGWLLTPNKPASVVPNPIALPASIATGLINYDHYRTTTDSYAGYGQATWNIASDWRLTGGLRYTYENEQAFFELKQLGSPLPLSSYPAGLQPTVTAVRNALAPVDSWTAAKGFSDLSGTLILAHDFTQSINGYLSYARGYKAAGINLTQENPATPKFIKPETVDSFEAGLKSRLFDGRLIFNADLFWLEDYNYQASFVNTAVIPAVTSLSNVGAVRSRGVEIDLRARPTDHLSLTFSGTYDDAIYQRYRNAPSQFLYSYLSSQNLTGELAAGTPRWALAATAEYARPVGSEVSGYIGGDVSYKSSYFAATNDDPYSTVKGYGLIGLHAGLRSDHGRWDASVWVRNLTNQFYYSTVVVIGAFGTYQGWPGEPRMVGVTLRGKF